MSVIVCAMLTLCLPLVASAQDRQVIEVQPVSATVRMLPGRVENWRLDGPVVGISPAIFSGREPERAQLLSEYGFRDMAVGEYVRGDGLRVQVEVFRFINFVAAYGAYSIERTPEARKVGLGTEGAMDTGHLWFYKGDYYVHLVLHETQAEAGALEEVARGIDNRLSARFSQIPVLVRHLPLEGLVAGSERFIAGPLGLTRFLGPHDPYDLFLLSSDAVEAVLAEYRLAGATSPLLIVEYHTPQLATKAFQQVENSYLAQGDAGQSRRILKREGNYIIDARNVQDRMAMQAVVDQIKYTPQIRWLKKDPWETLQSFQPEAQISLIDFYLTAFAFIGLALLVAFTGGVLLGTLIFFWRRWRRRLWPGFTDAGGMLRLNLDDIVRPQIEEESLKRLPGK